MPRRQKFFQGLGSPGTQFSNPPDNCRGGLRRDRGKFVVHAVAAHGKSDYSQIVVATDRLSTYREWASETDSSPAGSHFHQAVIRADPDGLPVVRRLDQEDVLRSVPIVDTSVVKVGFVSLDIDATASRPAVS